MRTSLFWLMLAAALATACGGGNNSNNGNNSGGTAATKAAAASTTAASASASTDVAAVKKTPASLAVDDAAWTGVKATALKTQVIAESKATHPVDVNMQALYSDSDIWFRFQWADTTNDATTVWQWDGTKWNGSVSTTADRLALYWQMAPSAEFESLGCAALCHKTSDPIAKWYMIAPHATDILDNWQWTASTSAPMGQVNDLSIKGAQSGDPTSTAYRESAIAADPGTGGTVANTNQAGDGPKSMQDPSKPASYGPNYLAVNEAVTLDVSKLKAGDKIPKSMLSPWLGDRGDVDAKTQYANGQYTVVFHRKLDTGHPDDDVKLAVGGTYTFGLAVWDQLDQENHTVTNVPYRLLLK
jgi:hypothetical protein